MGTAPVNQKTDETRSRMDGAAKDESAIRDLIKRYKICWEVWPEWALNKGQMDKTGFDLELLGTHGEGTGGMCPGCKTCVEVYDAMRRVADFILPDTKGLPIRYEIEPYEPALRYSPVRRNRPDVLLEVKIMHRRGLGPVDECEERCLQIMQNKLDALGAYRGRWSPDPDRPSSKYTPEASKKRHLNQPGLVP